MITATSLREFAARSNVTDAALLRHFAGTEELLAALGQRDADNEELARQLMQSEIGGRANAERCAP